MEKKQKSHPAYGTVKFSRMHGGGKTSLFGSSIKHNDTICMEVYHAEAIRESGADFYYGNNLMLRAELSYSQFAEAITSFGIGSGIPITLRYTEKDGQIPECDFTNKRIQLEQEFSQNREKVTEDATSLINEVAELFQKKTLSKSDKEEILKKLNMLNANISGNMDFLATLFNEQMDKTVQEAKAEIESFYQNKINTIANTAIAEHKEELKKLGSFPVEL